MNRVSAVALGAVVAVGVAVAVSPLAPIGVAREADREPVGEDRGRRGEGAEPVEGRRVGPRDRVGEVAGAEADAVHDHGADGAARGRAGRVRGEAEGALHGPANIRSEPHLVGHDDVEVEVEDRGVRRGPLGRLGVGDDPRLLVGGEDLDDVGADADPLVLADRHGDREIAAWPGGWAREQRIHVLATGVLPATLVTLVPRVQVNDT